MASQQFHRPRFAAGDLAGSYWLSSAAVALMAHAALIAPLIPARSEAIQADAGSSVVTLEEAPIAQSSSDKPSDLPPGPEQTAPQQDAQTAREEKKSEKVADLDPAPQTRTPEKPDVALPEPIKDPEPATTPKTKAQPAVDATPPPTAAPSAPIQAERPAGPPPGEAGERVARILAKWQIKLVTHLEKFKRYPQDGKGAQGVANVAFTMDRSGKLVSSEISDSSGSTVLDAAALEMVRRAQPLPAPPPETGDAQLTQVVPIRFDPPGRK